MRSSTKKTPDVCVVCIMQQAVDNSSRGAKLSRLARRWSPKKAKDDNRMPKDTRQICSSSDKVYQNCN